MKISDEELFALIFTFKEDSNFKTEYLKDAYVIERTNSGVGFFSTIKVDESIGHFANSKKYWERTFRHRHMPYGGCFMVRLEDNLQLELEAVAFESLWPETFVQSDFYE
jgi:hypothetical protein